MQWKDFSEGELINRDDESGCNDKDEDVLEQGMLEKLFIKGTVSDISQYWKYKGQNARSGFKLRKDYDNLSRQEKCSLCILSYVTRRQAMFKLHVTSFHKKIKYFNSQCFQCFELQDAKPVLLSLFFSFPYAFIGKSKRYFNVLKKNVKIMETMVIFSIIKIILHGLRLQGHFYGPALLC